jgi:hypothetical protein
MKNFKATPQQWTEVGVLVSATRDCTLELRARVEALEAQANHIPDATKMVPVATDEELRAAWNVPGTNLDAFRAIYDLGVAHGQAGSQKVAEPAPVAGDMAKSLAMALGLMASQATKAGQLEDAQILRHAAAMLMERSGQEAGR